MDDIDSFIAAMRSLLEAGAENVGLAVTAINKDTHQTHLLTYNADLEEVKMLLETALVYVHRVANPDSAPTAH